MVSWNVLAACHVREEYYPEIPERALDASARREQVIAVLARLVQAHQIDVAALQEVDEELCGMLGERGWEVAWASKERGHAEGVAVCVARGSAWELGESSTLLHQDGSGHVTQIAQLRQGGDEITVASTHVRWAPRNTPVHTHIGVGQILETASALMDAERSVLCGDVNDEPGGPVRRALEASGWEEIGDDRATAWIGGRGGAIDLIAARRLQGRALDLGISAAGPLPSLACPSDHIPIGAALGG